VKDITGQRFGKLVALSFSHKKVRKTGKSVGRTYFWTFQCDCGNKKVIDRGCVVIKQTRSCGCLAKLEEKQASFNAFYRDYMAGAKKRKHVFELSKEQFRLITSQECHYCGHPPDKERRGTNSLNGFYKGNGIDRMNNDEGYTLQNSVPCCTFCNFAKDTMSYSDFIAWIKQVYSFMKLNNERG
jgi:hypothetical protein